MEADSGGVEIPDENVDVTVAAAADAADGGPRLIDSDRWAYHRNVVEGGSTRMRWSLGAWYLSSEG